MVPGAPGSDPAGEVDLNQVVAYNVKAARELRGWTQEDLADRLEPYLGQRLTQAGVSSIERAWDSDRRREFDAHELLIFSLVFDLPMLWFLLPPPGDRRTMRATTRPVSELYTHLLGAPHQLEALHGRLKELGVHDPDAADDALRALSGADTPAHRNSYRERRKELLLALLDQHADGFDAAIDDLGRTVDHLRQVGLRGFIAEKTDDRDLMRPPPKPVAGTPSRTKVARGAPEGPAVRQTRPPRKPGPRKGGKQ